MYNFFELFTFSSYSFSGFLPPRDPFIVMAPESKKGIIPKRNHPAWPPSHLGWGRSHSIFFLDQREGLQKFTFFKQVTHTTAKKQVMTNDMTP